MPPSACAAYPVDLVDEHLLGAVTSAAAVRRSTAGVTTADPTTAAGTATCATISTVAARWHETDRFLALLSAIAELDPLGAAHGGDGGGSDAGCCVRVRERFVERLAAIWYDFDTLAACRRRPFRSWSRARRTIEARPRGVRLVVASRAPVRILIRTQDDEGILRLRRSAFGGGVPVMVEPPSRPALSPPIACFVMTMPRCLLASFARIPLMTRLEGTYVVARQCHRDFHEGARRTRRVCGRHARGGSSVRSHAGATQYLAVERRCGNRK